MTFGYVPSEPVLRGLVAARRAGRDRRARRHRRARASRRSRCCSPASTTCTAGAVRIDGLDVRDVTLDSLRAAIGVVFEDSFLFSDTLAANIAYGRPDATDEQIDAAARAAEADGVHPRAARRLRHRGRRAGPDAVRRPAPAGRAGPGAAHRPARSWSSTTRPRRSTPGSRRRSTRRCAGSWPGRTTLLIAHRRSTLAAGRPDRGAGRRPARRPRHARGADRALPAVPAAAGRAGRRRGGRRRGRARLLRERTGGRRGARPAQRRPLDGHAAVTPRLWPTRDVRRTRPHAAAARPRLAAQAARDRRGVAGSAARRSRWPRPAAAGGRQHARRDAATPELLAKVAALPPARDEPRRRRDVQARAATRSSRSAAAAAVRRRAARRPAAGRRSTRSPSSRCRGSSAAASTTASTAGAFHADASRRAGSAWPSSAPTGWSTSAQTVVVGRTGERLLYTLRVKIFAHLQRLGLDYYEREMAGRIMTRMTTDVDALSPFLQTGLITDGHACSRSSASLIALLLINLGLGAGRCSPSCRCSSSPRSGSGSSRRAAYAEARERVSAVNADLQENVAGRAGRAGLPRASSATAPGSRPQQAPTAAPGCGRSATSRCTSRSWSCCPTSPAALVLLAAARPGRAAAP